MTAPTTSYHLRPGSGWLNDPNGMVWADGVWHVFFQHNPDAPVHGQIAWGHATSRDLASWDLQPVAFSPSPGAPDAFGCWSGVFVPGHDRPAVVYSGIADDSLQSTICLRWGSPDLREWGAPVVVGRTPEADGVAIMRDPFVLEHAGRRLAVLGAGRDDGTPAVVLFDRRDELSWRYSGVLVADDPVLRAVGEADIWECPQLFPLGGRWVLIVSLQVGGVLGTVAAAVGDLVEEGGSWRFVAQSAHVVDGGSALYAPQVVAAGSQHGTDQDGGGTVAASGGQPPPPSEGEDPLLIGWVRQGHQDPAVRDHAGCLSLPRRLRLVDDVVTSQVDPGAVRVLAPGRARRLPAGEVDLGERRWVVDVVGDAAVEDAAGEAAGKGTQLRHPELGAYTLDPGDQVWVDGAVVELYRASGLPATWRHDEPWTLLVASDGAAEVRDVVPQVP